MSYGEVNIRHETEELTYQLYQKCFNSPQSTRLFWYTFVGQVHNPKLALGIRISNKITKASTPRMEDVYYALLHKHILVIGTCT